MNAQGRLGELVLSVIQNSVVIGESSVFLIYATSKTCMSRFIPKTLTSTAAQHQDKRVRPRQSDVANLLRAVIIVFVHGINIQPVRVCQHKRKRCTKRLYWQATRNFCRIPWPSPVWPSSRSVRMRSAILGLTRGIHRLSKARLAFKITSDS